MTHGARQPCPQTITRVPRRSLNPSRSSTDSIALTSGPPTRSLSPLSRSVHRKCPLSFRHIFLTLFTSYSFQAAQAHAVSSFKSWHADWHAQKTVHKRAASTASGVVIPDSIINAAPYALPASIVNATPGAASGPSGGKHVAISGWGKKIVQG